MPPQNEPSGFFARQRDEMLSLDTGDGTERDLDDYDPRQRDEILAVTGDGDAPLRSFLFRDR